MFGGKKIGTILLFVLILVMVINIAWWYYYNQTAQLLDQQLSRRLKALVETGTHLLNIEAVELLAYDNFTAFADVSERLEQLKQADSLAEVFILDAEYKILASTDLTPDSTYFLRELNGPYLDSIIFGWHKEALPTPSYKTGPYYLKSAFAPIYTLDGTILGVLGIEADVDYAQSLTDLKQNLYYATLFSLIGGIFLGLIFILFQRKLNRAEQAAYLNETHAYLGRMVAVVSHEIKNPLMILRASAERIRKKTDLEEADYIIEETDRMNRIVSNYLQFATGETALTANEVAESFEIGEFIANVKKHFNEQAHDQQIIWLPNKEINSTTVKSFPRLLRQVLLNLLLNGADACRKEDKPVVLGITGKTGDSKLIISVTDHGSGISKSEQKKLFSPFYTTKTTGSGLGLYLSRKLIEELGGTILIESELHQFTTVTLSLPIKDS